MFVSKLNGRKMALVTMFTFTTILSHLDDLPFNTVCRSLFARKLSINKSNRPEIPLRRNLYNKTSCQTQSKAFNRSRYTNIKGSVTVESLRY